MMQECGYKNRDEKCTLAVNSGNCPGQIEGKCVSNIDCGDGFVPCPHLFKDKKCLEKYEKKLCPGIEAGYCLSEYLTERKPLTPENKISIIDDVADTPIPPC